MYEVADRPDIYVTVLTGRGRFFSAGADVGFADEVDGGKGEGGKKMDEREKWLKGFVAGNLHVRSITHLIYFFFFLSSSTHAGKISI